MKPLIFKMVNFKITHNAKIFFFFKVISLPLIHVHDCKFKRGQRETETIMFSIEWTDKKRTSYIRKREVKLKIF